ncbi:MAG: hypothetical protein WC102_01660 [Saccharofermentanales bacterium]
MSHFTVLVFMRDDQLLENVLAPFDENKEVPPYISMKRDEFIADKRKIYKRDTEMDKESGDEIVTDYESMTDEEFLQAMRDLDYTLDASGNEISTYNHKSQWDWWAVGGRWSNKLKLKKPDEEGNDRCNFGRIKDINFDPDPERYKERARFWELFIEDAEPENEDEREMLSWASYKKEFYTKRYGTKENYATLESLFETWAVITPDGEWHEKGSMGWWGLSDESNEEACEWAKTYKEKFIDTADPELIAVLVDCHI